MRQAIVWMLVAWDLEMPSIILTTYLIFTIVIVLRAIHFSMTKRTMGAMQSPRSKSQPMTLQVNSATQIPPVYTNRELTANLPVVARRRIFIEFQCPIDIPMSVRESVFMTFIEYGARLSMRPRADVLVEVYATPRGRFVFSVIDPANQKCVFQTESGPNELAAAIVTAICEFFRQSDTGWADLRKAERRTQILQALDRAGSRDAKEVQRSLNCPLDDLVDAVINSIIELNRKITGAILAENDQMAVWHMEQLTRRIRTLGQLGDGRGVNAILDTLTEAVVAYHVTRSANARMVRDAAADALVTIGAPAIDPTKKYLQDSLPAVRLTLEAVQERLKREYS